MTGSGDLIQVDGHHSVIIIIILLMVDYNTCSQSSRKLNSGTTQLCIGKEGNELREFLITLSVIQVSIDQRLDQETDNVERKFRSKLSYNITGCLINSS